MGDMEGMKMDHGSMPGMSMKEMDHSSMHGMKKELPDKPGETPMGWHSGFPAGERVLSYADLKSLTPQKDLRPAGREITVHLGGSLERSIWTLNGRKFSEGEPIALQYGERVKITFVNAPMMAHTPHDRKSIVRGKEGTKRGE